MSARLVGPCARPELPRLTVWSLRVLLVAVALVLQHAPAWAENLQDGWVSLDGGTGMYFYDAKPRVWRNTITGPSLPIAFYVGGTSSMIPSLGKAVGDSCTACEDATRGGCNRVITEKDPAEWCVYADTRDSVWA